jgi:hypothetical protein
VELVRLNECFGALQAFLQNRVVAVGSRGRYAQGGSHEQTVS